MSDSVGVTPPSVCGVAADSAAALPGLGVADWSVAGDPATRERIGSLQTRFASLPVIAPVFATSVQSGLGEGFTLRLQSGLLTLVALEEPRWSGIVVDLLEGAMAHRRRQPIGGEQVVKAVWGRSKPPLRVLDATAGLGRDGFLLAASGAEVLSCERHPAIALLLADGLWRAESAAQNGEAPGVAEALARWQFVHGDAMALMATWPADVIYLDPMFPEREKSALVKKEMRAFRALAGEDVDAQLLFETALHNARRKVVVKRPANGADLGRKPAYSLEGKANRFDVYITGD